MIYTTYHWCKIPIWKVIEYLWSVIVVVSLTVPWKKILRYHYVVKKPNLHSTVIDCICSIYTIDICCVTFKTKQVHKKAIEGGFRATKKLVCWSERKLKKSRFSLWGSFFYSFAWRNCWLFKCFVFLDLLPFPLRCFHYLLKLLPCSIVKIYDVCNVPKTYLADRCNRNWKL